MKHRQRLVIAVWVIVQNDNIYALDDKNQTGVEAKEIVPGAVSWSEEPLCPLWGPMDTFYTEAIEKGRYLGRWWLQDKYSDLSDLTNKCSSQIYTNVNFDNQTVLRKTSFVSKINNNRLEESGNVNFKSLADANLFHYSTKTGFLPELVYRVLATDYETFTIEYTCQDSTIIKGRDQVWIYTREKRPSKDVLKRAYKSLKFLGLNGWKLKKMDQSCGEIETGLAAAAAGEAREHRFGSIRRNYEVGGAGGQDWFRGKNLVGDTAAAADYDYDDNYKEQAIISTGQLTSQMLSSGLQLAQSLFAPWTLHPTMGFKRKSGKPVFEDERRRRSDLRQRMRLKWKNRRN